MKPPKRAKVAKPKSDGKKNSAPVYRDDDPFDQVMLQSEESGPDSDVSEYGKKRKMTKKIKVRESKAKKVAPVPELPDISDDDGRQTRGQSLELGEVIELPKITAKTTSNNVPVECTARLPDVFQIHVDASTNGGHAIINLSISDLLKKRKTNLAAKDSDAVTSDGSMSPRPSIFDDNESTLHEEEPQYINKRVQMLRNAQAKNVDSQHKTSFLDIPYEIRVRIYRQVFVTANPIEFTTRESFQRSSAMLRTCKKVHEEGRAVLYGENSFHFERSSNKRGAFYESQWKEIGFKDVRRFLDLIGPANISCMKYVSFLLLDAPPSVTPELEEAERRFVNDPVLHYIFRLLGTHATMDKIGITFAGRKAVSTTEYHFLKALTRMKTHELLHTSSWPYHSKAPANLITKLKELMVVKRDHEEQIDFAKKKQPVVKMWHEKPKSYSYGY